MKYLKFIIVFIIFIFSKSAYSKIEIDTKITAPIETANGYLILKVNDRRKIDKWDSSVTLKTADISVLPKYISKNKEKFKNWLES